MTATCETCRWWASNADPDDEPLDQCRKHAPRPHNWEDKSWAEWPQTLPDDWCGEHQPKEPTP